MGLHKRVSDILSMTAREFENLAPRPRPSLLRPKFTLWKTDGNWKPIPWRPRSTLNLQLIGLFFYNAAFSSKADASDFNLLFTTLLNQALQVKAPAIWCVCSDRTRHQPLNQLPTPRLGHHHFWLIFPPSARLDSSDENGGGVFLRLDWPPSRNSQFTALLFTVDTEKIAVKEREAFNKLEQARRQWFLATLSNQFVEEPLQEAMDDPIHKEGKRRLQKNYKSWKHRTLKNALEWMRASRPENSKYNATANFACQRMAVSKSYDISLDTTEVFAWAPRGHLLYGSFCWLRLTSHWRKPPSFS